MLNQLLHCSVTINYNDNSNCTYIDKRSQLSFCLQDMALVIYSYCCQQPNMLVLMSRSINSLCKTVINSYSSLVSWSRMVCLWCRKMKFRIHNSIVLFPVLVIFLLCWMSYSALLCWASLKLSTESYLQHFAKKFCPSTYHTSEKTVSSFPDEHGRLSLVAKLWRDEHESMKILLAAGNICKQSESLSETRTSMEFLPASCVAIQSSQKTCHYSEEKKMSCDKKQHVICELKVSIERVINYFQ